MRAKTTYTLTAAALVGYALLAGVRGVLLIRHGTALTVAFGGAVLVLPLIGLWFLWQNTRFVLRAHRLAAELAAEGGLPVDELPRTPAGSPDRAAADALFRRRRAETEQAPDDWRCWFRLAVAYRGARDTTRARRAIGRAIALHALHGAVSSCEGPSPTAARRRKPRGPSTGSATAERAGTRVRRSGGRRSGGRGGRDEGLQ